MNESDPHLVPLADLAPGQAAEFFALLAEKTRGATRDGRPYYTCRFRGRCRTATLMVWADGGWFDDCERNWREGRFYRLRAAYGEHGRYGGQLEAYEIREATDADRADGFDPANLVERSAFDTDEMFAELCALAESQIARPALRALVLAVLRRHESAFKELPATSRRFHTFAGGLLEHTLSVAQSCVLLADYYARRYEGVRPAPDRDLIVAGAILHDVGRVRELDAASAGAEATVEGRLFGHLILGRDLIREAARDVEGLDPELLLRLEHVILTHLALPEWGSPRLPLVPEAILIHHADDLDAKLQLYARCLAEDREPGPFTATDPVLRRRLYKPRPDADS